MNKGMTLIEVLIYMGLLSLLMSSFINYVYGIQYQNMELMHDIEDSYASP